jgi:GDPmannose 4,6-dehydratase
MNSLNEPYLKKKALITGIAGQDGQILTKILLQKNYHVLGIAKNIEKIDYLKNYGVTLLKVDVCDTQQIASLLKTYKPNEIYNFAAQSSVAKSWQYNAELADVNGFSVERILETIKKIERRDYKIKFYQASTSEIFDLSTGEMKNEESEIKPLSPYGAAKAYAHMITNIYRNELNSFAVSGILFNHESVYRDLNYVSRKITHGVASIKLNLAHKLILGDLNSRRDWGYAEEYVQAIWSMMQLKSPENFVIASGKSHSVGELVEFVFELAHIKNYDKYIHIDKNLFRKKNFSASIGDVTKASLRLNWKPKKNIFQVLEMMYKQDLKALRETRS